MRREHRGELAWAVFCVGCAAAMLAAPKWQAVPFHWIWITLTFLYGFRRWTTAQTIGALGAVMAVTTIAMLRAGDGPGELTEVPLMTCVFLGMVWHVRRRQEAMEELRRTADRERQFMRDAAHTLRTPLTIAQGHAELLLDQLRPRTPRHDDATVLLDELRRLARISDQMLLLGTAPQSAALLLDPVDLREMASDATRRWSAASGRPILFERGASVVALADERRLRHALDALIENALHATTPGDRITVSACTEHGRATLQVADTGHGVDPADLPTIFERFARGAHARTRPGTGLGLPIVKTIAKAHGGDVSLDSRPGEGTTVTVRLGPALPAGPGAFPVPLRPLPATGLA